MTYTSKITARAKKTIKIAASLDNMNVLWWGGVGHYIGSVEKATQIIGYMICSQIFLSFQT